MERPLFVGVLWGVITGDMQTSVSLAVFYELFWLDLFPAGTYIPPNSLFPMITILVYADTLGEPFITHLFLPIIMTLPLAFLGSYVEKLQREWQVVSYNKIIKKLRINGDIKRTAAFSVKSSLFQLFIFNFVTFSLVTGLILLAFYTVAVYWPKANLTFAHASWPLLWSIGALGGILSLRIRRNYLVFIAGSVCAGLLAVQGIWI